MKKNHPEFILILIALLLYACEKDLPIPHNLFLSTQQQINDFDHVQIPGNLFISGAFIRDLTPR